MPAEPARESTIVNNARVFTLTPNIRHAPEWRGGLQQIRHQDPGYSQRHHGPDQKSPGLEKP